MDTATGVDGSEANAADLRLLAEVRESLRRPRWHLGFEPMLEARMEADQGAERSRHLVQAGLIALLIYDLFLINDYVSRPEVMDVALIGRLGLMTTIGAVVLLLVHRGLPAFWRDWLMAGTGVLAMAISSWIFHQTRSAAAAYDPFVFSLILMATNIAFPLRFVAAGVSSALALAVAAVGVLGHPLMPQSAAGFALGLLLGTAVFTVLAAYRIERGARQSYLLLLREELRTRSAQRSATAYARISQTDPLTKLDNRRAFDEALQLRWEAALPQGESLCLLMIDVDHFKRYNDHLGHPAGDECLRRVAAALRGATRPEDLLARIGGEEFALLPADGSMQIAAALASRLCKAVETMALPHDGQDGQAVVTVSVGLAGLRTCSDRAPADLLEEADRQLYVAKRTGRNRWVCADPALSAARLRSPETAPTNRGDLQIGDPALDQLLHAHLVEPLYPPDQQRAASSMPPHRE